MLTYSALRYFAIGMVITQGRWSGRLCKTDDREAFGTESKINVSNLLLTGKASIRVTQCRRPGLVVVFDFMYRSDLGRIDLCMIVSIWVVLNHATITRQLPSPRNLLIQGSCATVRRDRSQSSNKALFTKPLPRTSNIFKLRLYLQTFLLNPTDRRVAGNKYKPSTETTPTFVSSLATKLGLYSGTPHKTQCPDSASAYTGRPLHTARLKI